MPLQSTYAQSYNSFSGVDIKATAMGRVLATLQAISFSVTREKAPIFTLGNPEPRSFSRGKRGSAGTMIFILFDRQPLLGPGMGLGDAWFMADIDEIVPAFADQGGQGLDLQLKALASGVTAGTPVQDAESPLTSAGSDQQLAHPWFPDQLPPFDITLVGANEYGAMMKMAIIGAEILNEGSGISIDDIVTEHEFTYVCRTVIGWTPITPNFVGSVGYSEPTSSNG